LKNSEVHLMSYVASPPVSVARAGPDPSPVGPPLPPAARYSAQLPILLNNY
jgi:hypothetical protein